MGKKKHAARKLQWHPAFYADIQIELEDEGDKFTFENEHQLGTKPFGIDVLIIKKESSEPVQKNIGRIFRKYNIVEYKSPLDYLSVDDYYKVCGYACFYKADVQETDSIKLEELTISLFCEKYPRKLMYHLEKERKFEIREMEEGIYYVIGVPIPVQIVVTGRLSKKENLWLRSLTGQMQTREEAENLIREYDKHKNNRLYESVMNIIVQANKEKFEEVHSMCDALKELMKEEFDEKRREGERKGMIIGEQKGRKIGEQRINELNRKLIAADRMDDIIKAAADEGYQKELFREFGL